MCGISRVLAFKNSNFEVTAAYLARMRDTMIHRGPDGAGSWISHDRRVGLAHRRLSIIGRIIAGVRAIAASGAVCGKYRAVHHDRVLTEQDFLDFLPRMVYLQDEPIADPVCIRLFSLQTGAGEWCDCHQMESLVATQWVFLTR